MKHTPIIAPFDNCAVQAEIDAYKAYRAVKGVDATKARKAWRAWTLAKAAACVAGSQNA